MSATSCGCSYCKSGYPYINSARALLSLTRTGCRLMLKSNVAMRKIGSSQRSLPSPAMQSEAKIFHLGLHSSSSTASSACPPVHGAHVSSELPSEAQPMSTLQVFGQKLIAMMCRMGPTCGVLSIGARFHNIFVCLRHACAPTFDLGSIFEASQRQVATAFVLASLVWGHSFFCTERNALMMLPEYLGQWSWERAICRRRC